MATITTAQVDTDFRGSSLRFTATCKDANGNVVLPASANLYLVYTAVLTGALTHEIVSMTIGAITITADWDSSVAKEGVNAVRWSIRTTGTKIAVDGSITLLANEANPTS